MTILDVIANIFLGVKTPLGLLPDIYGYIYLPKSLKLAIMTYCDNRRHQMIPNDIKLWHQLTSDDIRCHNMTSDDIR